MNQITFPQSFLWGSATSSYQIEGASTADGKGPSIWDTFCDTPGKIIDGSSGDEACDHYHRWPEDIALMKKLGLQAYRFSVAWPRIQPTGVGSANAAGLDFYSRLVDGLLEANIIPFITLYHWDLPQALQDKGGWTNRDTAYAFAEYADIVSLHLGDRVKNWITHNEPWCASFLSYQVGEHAPGWQDWLAGIKASHHILLSHGLAVPRIRANSPTSEVGITLNFTPSYPATASAEDYALAREFDGYFNRWFLDPLYGRRYPADKVQSYISHGQLPNGLDFVQEEDYATIAAHTDFLGVNYYTRAIMGNGARTDGLSATRVAGDNITEMGWEVFPEGMYDLLNRLHFEYQVPKLYITENGCSYSDGPDANGRIADERRTNYLREHFLATHRAMANGAPVAGYFVWSFMDNFEWAKGYEQRFGMVWVDYKTQQRLPKDSALWLSTVIAQNGFSI